jgi:hypothetical protein
MPVTSPEGSSLEGAQSKIFYEKHHRDCPTTVYSALEALAEALEAWEGPKSEKENYAMNEAEVN